MASSRRLRPWGSADARYSKNTVGRTHSIRDKAGRPHKPTEVYDFSDNSAISNMGRMSENEKDESYESFEPPLHSTAIYTDEAELAKHCGSLIHSASQGKEVERSSNTSELEESENESVKVSAKKARRKLDPISDESESCEGSGGFADGNPAEARSQPLELAERPAGHRAKSSVDRQVPATASQPKTQKKKILHGKRKKTRNEAIESDLSDCAYIWCLKGKKSSDITDLDVVLSAFENTLREYKQNIESRICKEAINKFHSSMKEELIKTLTEIQMLKTLQRKNAKMISDIEKKRQRLIEVQDELLWLEPQLKQLQRKHDELKERKSSLRNAACFLSNLKQLHQDYSSLRERDPNVKETYDSSSLPALLFKVRTLLGAESHLQNINHQLEKLLDQK